LDIHRSAIRVGTHHLVLSLKVEVLKEDMGTRGSTRTVESSDVESVGGLDVPQFDIVDVDKSGLKRSR